MPSSLAKVQKHVHKKKGNKINSLHENSRDAQRLRKAGARDDRVARLHAVQKKANRLWIERVAYFQERLPDTLHPMQVDVIQQLISDYIARNVEELEVLKAERRSGRPASTRQTLLEQQRTLEEREYESGFWLPDLQDEQTLQRLDSWKGDWVGLGVMKFVRVEKGGLVKDSQFPPRGAS
ncbi:translation machinery-associated protein 16 [Vermiconidia calcicola]|uniref:Translation machinery-associated protein 16 n=1 Tax=Vermiconidia calcicola TaxID=1690605 RepID=A0ACC3ML89_9PEZI|nr:translation machinery-associated protein 16 [Vermiconidia calcicola]